MTFLPRGQTRAMASEYFHFGSIAIMDSCYIAYENSNEQHETADNKSVPKRKPFVGVSYDEESRTFSGRIVWTPTTFEGAQRWEFTMVFDEAFRSIVGGQRTAYGNAGEVIEISTFAADLNFDREEDKNKPDVAA